MREGWHRKDHTRYHIKLAMLPREEEGRTRLLKGKKDLSSGENLKELDEELLTLHVYDLHSDSNERSKSEPPIATSVANDKDKRCAWWLVISWLLLPTMGANRVVLLLYSYGKYEWKQVQPSKQRLGTGMTKTPSMDTR